MFSWPEQVQKMQSETEEQASWAGSPHVPGTGLWKWVELVGQDVSKMSCRAGMNWQQVVELRWWKQAWQGQLQQATAMPETVACEEHVELEASPESEMAEAPV